MGTVEVKRIGLLSIAIRGCMICSAAGFILGLIGAFWVSMIASTMTLATGVDMTGAGYAMLVLAPLMGMLTGGIAGTMVIVLMAFLYNLTAKLFGGVTMDVSDIPGTMSPNDSNPNHRVNHFDDRYPPPPVSYPI